MFINNPEDDISPEEFQEKTSLISGLVRAEEACLILAAPMGWTYALFYLK